MITKSSDVKQCHTTSHLRQIVMDESALPQSKAMASGLMEISELFRDGFAKRVDELTRAGITIRRY